MATGIIMGIIMEGRVVDTIWKGTVEVMQLSRDQGKEADD